MRRIKVCGINRLENALKIAAADPDYMGFIFYDKSPRFIGKGDISPDEVNSINARKVGVFVNQSLDEISIYADQFGLDYVQLHGDESPDFCWEIKSLGLGVIKAIRISDKLPLSELKEYSSLIDLFLFDTSSPKYGGSGVKFEWDILKEYNLDVPYFLSGGIAYQDISILTSLNFEGLYGFDINSKFEVSPGLKDPELVASFIQEIRDKYEN